MRCAAASWRTPRSGSARQAADGDWRVTITLHDAAHAQRAVQSVREVLAQRQLSADFALDRWHPSHHEAVALAGRLRADGRPVIRRWKYLLLGASSAAEASDLAEAIEREVPATASVHASAVPFTHFGLDQIGSGPNFPLT
jgi:hypothetical protein